MRKPDESLEDYSVGSNSGIPMPPPRRVTLQSAGTVKVLQPINETVRSQPFVKPAFRAQPLWFRRFLAVGSGALVVTALILISAILVGINEPERQAEAVSMGELPEWLRQPEKLFTLDIESPAVEAIDLVRLNTKRKITAPVLKRRLSRPTPVLREPLEPDEPNFVPTTLVIYAENGVINSRIEPWIQVSYKKPATVSN